jgi:5,10-methylenetetrahydrofolate reductase
MSLERLRNKGHLSHPLLCLEVNPPRGADPSAVFKRLNGRLEGIDFLNITDCALAKLRLAALPFAALVKNALGIEPLVNVSCRDRNLTALQADLLAAWAMGVRSIVALTGDAMSAGDTPDRKSVFEVNSIGLLKAISSLNEGLDLAGVPLKGKTQFVNGAVVNPNARNKEAEIKRFLRKKEAGALFALSQPVFDEEESVDFFRRLSDYGVPTLMGLLPLKSVKSARLVARVPGIKLSESLNQLIEGASEDKDLSDFSLEHCVRLCSINRPYVAGFHVISGPNANLALELSAHLAKNLCLQNVE